MAVTGEPAPVTRATAERVFLIVLMAGSSALFYEALNYPRASFAFPGAILVLLFGCSVAALLRGRRRPAAGAEAAFFDHPSRFALALLLLVAYTAVLETVGYFTTGFAMIVLLPVMLGYREWRVILSTAAIYLLFVWLVFHVIFQREMARDFFLPWILGY